MTTGRFGVDLLVFYVPALLALVMAILGALRGVRREAVVSGSIVLSALILMVWGGPWAADLHAVFTNVSEGDMRNILSYVVAGLVVIVVGYLLGSAIVPRTPVSPLSRLGGFLLGMANGLALGGYFIRWRYDSAVADPGGDGRVVADLLTTNEVSRYLWIWANWFPLAVALVAALVALIGPFRRAQTAVSTPSTRTDWGPTASPAVGTGTMAAPGPAAYTTGYGQGFAGQVPQQGPGQQLPPGYQQPYSPYPQFGQPSAPPPAAPPPPYGGARAYPSASPAPVTQGRLDDAPPTTLMPRDEAPGTASSAGQSTIYMGTQGQAGGEARAGAGGDKGGGGVPDWMRSPEPSWLTTSQQPQAGSAQPVTPPPAPTGKGTGPLGDAEGATSTPDNSLLARSEAPTVAQPVLPTTAQPAAGADSVVCPRCGTRVPGDATFCTECGNRLK